MIDSFADAIYQCAAWHLSRMLHHGARWFKGLVQLGEEQKTKPNRFGFPSLSQVFDTIQGNSELNLCDIRQV